MILYRKSWILQDPNLDLNDFVTATEGYSGSDLMLVCKEAAMVSFQWKNPDFLYSRILMSFEES